MKPSERLKNIREDLVKTQKEMASMLGIAPRTWQNYEEGIHDPSWKVIEGLVDMGFNANWILSGEGRMHNGYLITPFLESEWNVNERIKLIRGDMSLDEFSNKLGVYKSEIDDIENNHAQPEGYLLSKICSELNINPTWLLIGKGDMKEGDKDSINCDTNFTWNKIESFDDNIISHLFDAFDKLSSLGINIGSNNKARIFSLAYQYLLCHKHFPSEDIVKLALACLYAVAPIENNQNYKLPDNIFTILNNLITDLTLREG